VINDGEFVKAAIGGFGGYMQHRVTGWESDTAGTRPPKHAGVGARDREDFPGTYASGLWWSGSGGLPRPGFMTPGEVRPGVRGVSAQRICTGPISYTGYDAIAEDIAELREGLATKPGVEGFVASLGPLSLGGAAVNEYYPSEEEYMMAVAEACREEYKAITAAGYIVQMDEPAFATTWSFYPDWTLEDLRKKLAFYVDVVNHSLEGVPEDQVRFHFCWGSGHRPHVQDIEVKHLADLMLRINAQAYSVEAGNVRHAHEWRVWGEVGWPDGKILVPGVVSHATDLVEHPELIAERLVNFASVIGKENLQAGTDCGIGYRVGHEEIAWAKLASMSEGCRLASEQLY
jgi:5-methyltetrahydropteroyltriglutamate--homocysteine methyltransferase